MWCKAEFSTSVLRAPLEIILTCWFSDHETVFIMLKKLHIFVWTLINCVCMHMCLYFEWPMMKLKFLKCLFWLGSEQTNLFSVASVLVFE